MNEDVGLATGLQPDKADMTLSGKARRYKGAQFERDCVNAAKGYNIPTERVGHAQTSEYSTSGDIAMKVMGLIRQIECKVGSETPRRMYQWIMARGGNWAVVHRRDGEPALLTMRYSDFLKLVHAAAYGKVFSDMNLPTIKSEEEVDAE